LRRAVLIAAIGSIAVAGCGGRGGEAAPHLADGSLAPRLPDALLGVHDAVMTRAERIRPGRLDGSARVGCDLLPEGKGTLVVKRVDLHGTSLTFANGGGVYGCDAIPDRLPDPDLPKQGGWCGGAVGHVRAGTLRDLRLDLCTATDHSLTAFAWMLPRIDAHWVAVESQGEREIYEVVAGLPIRITTVDRIDAETSTASFRIEEYDRQGRRSADYELRAAVAG
jgi:hypothetical protein